LVLSEKQAGFFVQPAQKAGSAPVNALMALPVYTYFKGIIKPEFAFLQR
jgi:hypothetical protein